MFPSAPLSVGVIITRSGTQMKSRSQEVLLGTKTRHVPSLALREATSTPRYLSPVSCKLPSKLNAHLSAVGVFSLVITIFPAVNCGRTRTKPPPTIYGGINLCTHRYMGAEKRNSTSRRNKSRSGKVFNENVTSVEPLMNLEWR